MSLTLYSFLGVLAINWLMYNFCRLTEVTKWREWNWDNGERKLYLKLFSGVRFVWGNFSLTENFNLVLWHSLIALVIGLLFSATIAPFLYMTISTITTIAWLDGRFEFLYKTDNSDVTIKF